MSQWNVKTDLPAQIVVIQISGLRVDTEQKAFNELQARAQAYRERYAGRSIGDVEGVQAARRLFRAIGIDPTRRRPSSEALLKRALQEKAFYPVNSLVDVGNWCSLDFLLPIGIYDARKIEGDVTIRTGNADDEYAALNNRVISLHQRYALADASGAFGSPMTDSQRTAVDLTTQDATLALYAPADYAADALNARATLFAQRVTEVCGGEVTSIHSMGQQHGED